MVGASLTLMTSLSLPPAHTHNRKYNKIIRLVLSANKLWFSVAWYCIFISLKMCDQQPSYVCVVGFLTLAFTTEWLLEKTRAQVILSGMTWNKSGLGSSCSFLRNLVPDGGHRSLPRLHVGSLIIMRWITVKHYQFLACNELYRCGLNLWSCFPTEQRVHSDKFWKLILPG